MQRRSDRCRSVVCRDDDVDGRSPQVEGSVPAPVDAVGWFRGEHVHQTATVEPLNVEFGQPRLYCVIVTFRRHRGFERVLDLVAEQERQPVRLVIVDNERSAVVHDVVERRRQGGIDIVYLTPEANVGPAGGTAHAMQFILEDAADEDWITRLDDDLGSLDPDIFGKTLDFATAMVGLDPAVGAVGAVGSRYDWRRGRLVRIADDEIGTEPIPVDYVPTNLFPAFRVEAVRSVGTFDPRLFFGFSEVEYGLRLRSAGRTLYANPELWKRLGRQTESTSGPSLGLRPANWRRYYSLRNQVHVLRAAGHPVVALRVGFTRGLLKPLVHVPFGPSAALTHLRIGWPAVCDGWNGKLGRTIDPDDLDEVSTGT